MKDTGQKNIGIFMVLNDVLLVMFTLCVKIGVVLVVVLNYDQSERQNINMMSNCYPSV